MNIISDGYTGMSVNFQSTICLPLIYEGSEFSVNNLPSLLGGQVLVCFDCNTDRIYRTPAKPQSAYLIQMNQPFLFKQNLFAQLVMMPAVDDVQHFVALAMQLFVPDSFRYHLTSLNYGTIRLFSSIHSLMCVASPSDEALQDVCLLITSAYHVLSFSADDLRRLRGFAMACSHELAAAQQAAVTFAGPLPTSIIPAPTISAPDIYDKEEEKDRRMASIVARQWAA